MSKFKNLLEWAFEPPKRSNELGFQFVMAELETGLMFCRQAVGTAGEQGVQYRVNARSSLWSRSMLSHATSNGKRSKTKNANLGQPSRQCNQDGALEIGVEMQVAPRDGSRTSR
jgi:hypothetical protein